jgi:hypothetical protein
LSSSIEKDDPLFPDDLKESHRYVWIVAEWLSSFGHHVTVRAQKIRPSVAEMDEYADDGDIEIIQRVEVKRRPDMHFTGKGDFQYETVFVDVAHAWDKAKPKPVAYVILNAKATHCLVVKGDTSKYWIKRTCLDTKKKRERTFYECPIKHCTFHVMPKKSV